MTIVISLCAWIIAAPPLFALSIYIAEVVAGLRASAADSPAHASSQQSIAFLVPAHNEALIIVDMIEALKSVAPHGSRILVVADNCSDATALLARSAGAEVAERFDPQRLGKGYALAFGRDVLAASPPACVIVLDADAELSPGSAERLCAVTKRGEIAQASYYFTPDKSAPGLVQISSFAFFFRNVVRSRGVGRLGRCAPLTGSGMAFPWADFATAPLASADITEDLGLVIALVSNGRRTRFVEQAVVLSRAAGVDASLNQRRRWEHGFLASALQHALPLLLRGLSRPSRAMTILGLHLLVPPLSLLMLISLGSLAALLVIGLLSGLWMPAAILGLVMVAALGLTASAWLRWGRDTLRFRALLQAPLYIVWKLPLYVRFLLSRETTWRRTSREGEI